MQLVRPGLHERVFVSRGDTIFWKYVTLPYQSVANFGDKLSLNQTHGKVSMSKPQLSIDLLLSK